jgi:digeranylgeranylglycerophospholipid reductase
MAAKHSAQGGCRTLLIEKKAEIGAPLRCAEGVSKRRLLEVGIMPDDRWISQKIIGSIMRSPSGKALRVVESKDGFEVGYVLNRHLFDKALAEQAADAGAEVLVRTGCTGVIKENGKVAGVKVSSMGEKTRIYGKCVIAADGFESQVARWAGMDTGLTLSDMDSCIQYRMTNVSVEQQFCEFIIGSRAPGGYAWIFPKGGRSANVGIGIQGTRCSGIGEPKRYLDEFVKNDARLKNGEILEIVGGAVSTKPGLDCTVDDNIVLAGDAARVINPLTGGGIANACLTGKLAGEAVSECMRKDDLSKASLMSYDTAWRERIGTELEKNWHVKEKFVEMPDEILDGFVEAISSLPIERIRANDLIKAAKERFPRILE